MEGEYGLWEPLSPREVASLLAGYRGRWWIAGGWCLERDFENPRRIHEDTDIEVLRSELHLLHDALPGWELHACRWPGRDVFTRWTGGSLPPEVHDIWCRNGPDDPWSFQFMVLDDEADRWIFRRDHRIGGYIDDLTVMHGEIPLLAPEVQLLFKSRGRRPKDEADLDFVLPILEPFRIAWLREALEVSDPANPWLSRLINTEYPSCTFRERSQRFDSSQTCKDFVPGSGLPITRDGS